MSNKWTKWKIGYGIFLFLYVIILVVLKQFVPREVIAENIINMGATIFLFLFLVPIIVWVGVNIIKYFINSINNIHFCGDKLFEELDSYGIHWGESKEHYQDMINVINFYYKEGGKVDTIVGNDLKRLYNRLEFLKRELSTKEHLITCVVSFGLSICATIFLDSTSEKDINQTWYMILFCFLFLAIVLVRYFGMFHEGSNQISEYELKLLKRKIAKAEEEVSEVYAREDILLTKQNVLNELMDRCVHAYGKKKEEIEKDIRAIEKLNLNIRDTYSLNEQLFQIGKKKRMIVMFMDKNDNWVNKQYEILYEVLRKYDLVSEKDEKK